MTGFIDCLEGLEDRRNDINKAYAFLSSRMDPELSGYYFCQ